MSYYRFNQIAGRIQAAGASSYIPQGLVKSTNVSSAIQRDAFTDVLKVAPLPRGTPMVKPTSVHMSTAVGTTGKYGVVPNTPHYKKLMETQQFFMVS